jgi:acyl-CoA reductase-like NAD-dependent aldehyde dehydrogenase
VEYKLFIDGQWIGNGSHLAVLNKYNGQEIATLPEASRDDVDRAIAAARRAADEMAAMPAHRRHHLLAATAAAIAARREELARTIAAEAGKALKYARAEVDRSISTFTIGAEEARRIHGETVPLDALPAGEGCMGFWTRRPVGVVAAITPFNFPLNLVAHKVAPALAAGNSLVLKPASSTPITAVKLCEILQEVGYPAGAINLIVGPGRTVGEWLASDPRVDKVTFTGSPAVGRKLLAVAGIKKVTLELGNNSPVILAEDADVAAAARRCAVGAYYNSGQVCISVQRIYAASRVYDEFAEQFTRATEKMVVGDPLDERVDVGPMISSDETDRIEGWVDEARQAGAQILTGARRDGPTYWPTILAAVKPDMKVVAQEAFAPVASVISCDSFEEALTQANAGDYGLQASVFTRDLGRAFKAIQKLNFGGVIINDTPNFRVDPMPYGGNKQSGLGREGLRFAIEEMTNIQMVAIRLEG